PTCRGARQLRMHRERGLGSTKPRSHLGPSILWNLSHLSASCLSVRNPTYRFSPGAHPFPFTPGSHYSNQTSLPGGCFICTNGKQDDQHNRQSPLLGSLPLRVRNDLRRRAGVASAAPQIFACEREELPERATPCSIVSIAEIQLSSVALD